MLDALVLAAGLALVDAAPASVRLRPAMDDADAPRTIYSLVQEPDGFIWLGTDSGVYRFDGRHLVRFGQSDGLGSDNAGNLLLDPPWLWIGTWGGGLYRLNITSGAVERVSTEPQGRFQSLHQTVDGQRWFGSADQGLAALDADQASLAWVEATAGRRIWDLAGDGAGGLWVATDAGLGNWQPGTESWRFFSAERGNPYGFDHRQIRALHRDGSGYLWLATRASFGRFDAEQERYTPHPDGPGMIVNRIVDDGERGLWLGTVTGLLRFDLQQRAFDIVDGRNSIRLLPTRDIRDVLPDGEGGLWLATRYAGLLHLSFESLQIDRLDQQLSTAAGSTTPPVIQALSAHDGLWAGTSAGLYRRPSPDQGFHRIELDSGLAGPVRLIAPATDGRTWVVTDRRLLSLSTDVDSLVDWSGLLEAHSIDQADLNDVLVDRLGRLYLSTAHQGVLRIEIELGLVTRVDDAEAGGAVGIRLLQAQPGRMSLDAQGRLWVASFDRYLFLFDPTGPDWRMFQLPIPSSGRVYRLVESSAGNHWLVTSHGLYRFEATLGRFEAVALPLGNDRAELRDGLLDRDGRLWLASDAGLILLDALGQRTSVVATGLEGDHFQRLVQDDSGQMFAAGRTGVRAIRPGQIPAQSAPSVQVVAARVDDEAVSGLRLDALELPPNYQLLSLELATPGLLPGRSVMLRYRAEDDPAWQHLQSGQPLTLGRLTPGRHAYELQAGLPPDSWGPVTPINMVIPRPWHRNPVLLTLVVLMTALLLWLLHQGRVYRLKKQRRRMQRLLDDQAEALGQQHQQLLVTEKMATLGNLTAGVAHEINNPIAFTHAATQNLEQDLGGLARFLDDLAGDQANPDVMAAIEARIERLRDHARTSREGCRRIQRLVRDLRIFSRLDEAERKTVDLADNLSATLRLVKTRYQHEVNFELDLAENNDLACWPAQLNQVFMNLTVNACQAVQHRHGAGGAGKVTIRSRQQPGELIVEFQDNGPGIEPDLVDRVFDPLFTTKPSEQGTGMGLAISRNIVERHGGRIEVTNWAGNGCCFRLILPR